MNRFSKYSFYSLLLFITACGSSNELADSNIADAYQENSAEIEFEYQLFHSSADSSRLYFKINTSNLLYARRGDKSSQAAVIAEVSLANTTEPLKIIRVVDTDEKKLAKTLIASADFMLQAGKKYDLEVTLTDENRGRSKKVSLIADKVDLSNRQNYLLSLPDRDIPIFTDRVKPNEVYNLIFNSEIKDQIYVRFYNRAFPMPPPPFVFYQPNPFEYEADSTTTIPVNGYNEVKIRTGFSGFYHFHAEEENRKGKTIFVSESEFPEVKTTEHLLEPLRYLVAGREYDQIAEAPDIKLELENTWIKWAGSKERARKSIKAYYKRVENANQLFSSHVEGWKSDRGLVFIVYGKPNKVYRTDKVETWIYGEENNPLSITFHFVKVINPFTDNDYRLNREEFYKPSWYRSVNAWRDGRIY